MRSCGLSPSLTMLKTCSRREDTPQAPQRQVKIRKSGRQFTTGRRSGQIAATGDELRTGPLTDDMMDIRCIAQAQEGAKRHRHLANGNRIGGPRELVLRL